MPDYTTPVPPDPHVTVSHLFAQIPQDLLYDPDISAEAVRVYGVLFRHGSDPSNCFPSHRRIADFIGKSQRSVPGWIRQLEEAGWVKRVPRWRRGTEVTTTPPPDKKTKEWEPTSNAYIVHSVRAAQRALTVPERAPLTAEDRAPSAPPRAPKESNVNESKVEREKPLATLTLASALAPDFEDYWASYPNKRGKPAAKKAWAKALTRDSAENIIAGAVRYANDPNREPRFDPYPQKWLNEDRWNDPPLASRSGLTRPTQVDAHLADALRFANGEGR